MGTHEDTADDDDAALVALALALALVDAATGVLVSVTPTAAQSAWLYAMALARSEPEHADSMQVVVPLTNAGDLHRHELSVLPQLPKSAFARHGRAQPAIRSD